MSYGIQCCIRCGDLEHGHTGPCNKYVCTRCYVAGWRVDCCGNLYDAAAAAARARAAGIGSSGGIVPPLPPELET